MHVSIFVELSQSVKLEKAISHEPGVTMPVASAKRINRNHIARIIYSRLDGRYNPCEQNDTHMFTVYGFISVDGKQRKQFRIAHSRKRAV